MDWCHYRFRSVWDPTAGPDAVYTVLERAEEHPPWWPQVREVTALDDLTGILRLGSFLPYELRVTVLARLPDPVGGVLEAGMEGDVDGWARRTLTARGTGTGTLALYEQEVEVRKPLMRRQSLPRRPVFRANHPAMTRGGRRGLSAYLGGV
jgi:hypothetical protein